ncbi:MAG: hypothetical protein R3C05_26660 [Pirellulaceae bacterium]
MRPSETEPIPRDRAVFFSRPITVAYNPSAGVRSLSAQMANDSFDDRATRGGIRLSSYLEIPFLHKRLLMGCLAAAIIAGWLVLLLSPRVYESEAKLMLKVGRESVGLDPTATMGQTLMLQKTQEEEITSALEILGSRQVHETVVERLGTDPILSGYVPGDGTTEQAWIKTQLGWLKNRVSDVANYGLVASGIRDPISDHELAVRELQDTVGIYARRNRRLSRSAVNRRAPRWRSCW